MKKDAGLWIDYRRVVILTLVDQMEETNKTISDSEKQARYWGVSHGAQLDLDTAEIRQDKPARRLDDYLSPTYDGVIVWPRDVDSMLIFGSDEVKSELQKQLEAQALRERIPLCLRL